MSDFSADQVASMRETWIAAGNPAEAFDAAMNPPAADPSPTVQRDAPAPTALTEGITPDQAKQMAEDLKAAGMDPARVDAALAADGITVAEDTRTPEEREFDRLFPAATPASYKPSYYGRVPEGTAPETLAEFHQNATEWASAMQLAPEIGTQVIERSLEIGPRYNTADDFGKTNWKVEQRAAFVRASGGEAEANARLANVRELLAKAPAAFRDALYANGTLHDAAVVNLLALEAERLKLRH